MGAERIETEIKIMPYYTVIHVVHGFRPEPESLDFGKTCDIIRKGTSRGAEWHKIQVLIIFQ